MTMTPAEIDAALDSAEASPEAPSGTGYWAAVTAVKRDPALVERYAERIGRIDQRWFRSQAGIVVPLWPGTVLAVVGVIAGLVLIGIAYGVDAPWNGIWFLVGTGAVLVPTHSLGHLAVGWALGIRFTVWFAFFRRPQPGVKTDYASYLRTPARHRAWMHASGAIVTKVIPFLLLPSALIAGIPWWAVAALLVLGVGSIITDVVWSTRTSDWAKYRREMAIARADQPR